MTGTAIQVAFPQVGTAELAVPPLPVAAASTGLATVATQPVAEAKRTLICSALLQGDTRAKAEEEARKVYREMLDNTQVVMAFGQTAVDAVNVLVQRLLKEVEPVRIPELLDIMKELNREVRGIQSRYDVSDPKVREKYEEWKGGIGRFFGRAKTLIELLMEDVLSLETQLDRIEQNLEGRQTLLLRNVSYYDQLYRENEQEVLKLIYVIGVMELIRDLAAEEAARIEVGDASLGDRGGEEQAALAQFANTMELKIAEYKGRLFVAWATAPQVRMMRELNVGLAIRINELKNLTIPTMRGTILHWRMMVESQDAAQLSKAVQDASNEWLQRYAAAGAVVVPAIAQAVQIPTLQPQTIYAMADSIVKQADGIIQAMQDGAERRAEMDTAINEAGVILASAAQRVSDEAIEHVLAAARKPLEIATSVPTAG